MPDAWWPTVRSGELVRYLNEEEYVRLLDDTIPVSAEPGDVIFFKGAPSTSLVLVVEGELEVFEESRGKMVVLGLVTSKSGTLESKDEIKRRIDQAAKFVPLDQLCLSPQCGFASSEEGNILAEEEQWAKLRMIVEIADEVWR